jgi:glycosyltransferase involved in cell wall biosynthesis
MNQKKLRILHINYDWRNIFGTNKEEVLQKFKRDQLQPDLNEFFIISWSHIAYDKQVWNNFSSVHLKARFPWFRPLYDFLTLWYTPYLIRKHKFVPDVVLVYDTPLLFAAQLVKWRTGAKVVLCLTNLPVEYSRARKFGFLKSLYSMFFFRLAKFFVDYVYTINETVKQYCMEGGIPEHRIHIFVSDVIRQDILKGNVNMGGQRLREQYSIGDKHILLSVGRIQPEKGFDRLVKAFARINDKNYILLIVGQATQEVYRKELVVLIQNLGLQDRVIFCGVVPRDRIWQYYSEADAFVLLSRAEALGLVFWEAMYAGLPVLGSHASGIVESIGKNEERGYLWDESDGYELFEEKIRQAVTHTEETKEKIARAKEHVAQKIANTITINDVIHHE